MIRVRLRSLMLVVAAFVVLLGGGLGLRRRSERFRRLDLLYFNAGERLGPEMERLEQFMQENYDHPGVYPAELRSRVATVWGELHWYAAVAEAFRSRSERPWIFWDPDPAEVRCRCDDCRNGNNGIRPYAPPPGFRGPAALPP